MIPAVGITDVMKGKVGRINSPAHIIRLGMPQLAFSGLSESWLLRECGNRHWMLLAAAFKVRPDNLVDSIGDRLYPSFVGYRILGALASFEEGDEIEITSAIDRVSKNRFLSTHQVAGSDGRLLAVEMISILLKRKRAERNGNLISSDTVMESELPARMHEIGPG